MAGIVIGYNGDIEEEEKLLEPLRKFGPPIADLVSPMPYTVVQTVIEALTPAGRQNYKKAHSLADLSGEAIDIMIDSFKGVTPLLGSDRPAHWRRDAAWSRGCGGL